MADSTILVRLELKSKELEGPLSNVINSTEGFRLRDAEDSGPFELLILEFGKDMEHEFQVVQSFLNLGTVREIFLTSPKEDPQVLVRALRLGVREFLTQPLQEQEVRQALEGFRQRRLASKEERKGRVGEIIDVVAGKGGIGNTTIAVNLAESLARLDRTQSVALIDLNLLFGEIPIFLDIKPSFHWGEIARNISRLDAMFLMNVLHRHSSGVYVLPSPTELDGTHHLTPEIIANLLELMKSIFDYTIIDLGQNSDDVALSVLESSDLVLLTAVQSVSCLTNLNRLIPVLSELGFTPNESIKLIINRYLSNAEISLADVELSIRMKVSWTVPNDFRTTMSAINQGKPLSEVALRSPVARSIRQMARELSGAENIQLKKPSFMERLFRKS